MAETNITIRTSTEIADKLKTLGGSRTAGGLFAIEGYLNIRKYVLHELKGIFRPLELTAIVDAQNGTMMVSDYQANKGVFFSHLEDAEMLDNTFTRHGANWQEAAEKVKKMTSAQVFILQAEINTFWESDNKDLNQFIARF